MIIRSPVRFSGALRLRETIVVLVCIAAAACIFPVSQRQDLDRNLGLRHRAAIGLSEEGDAVILIVSEETGKISICHRGALEREFTPESLRKRLAELLIAPAVPPKLPSTASSAPIASGIVKAPTPPDDLAA